MKRVAGIILAAVLAVGVVLAVALGSRSGNDPATTPAAVVKERGITPPPDLVDVVEPPSYEVLEAMITALQRQYGS